LTVLKSDILRIQVNPSPWKSVTLRLVRYKDVRFENCQLYLLMSQAAYSGGKAAYSGGEAEHTKFNNFPGMLENNNEFVCYQPAALPPTMLHLGPMIGAPAPDSLDPSSHGNQIPALNPAGQTLDPNAAMDVLQPTGDALDMDQLDPSGNAGYEFLRFLDDSMDDPVMSEDDALNGMAILENLHA
jgi:hypothetical protein